MVRAERVPEHDVFVFERTVGFCPARQAVEALVLVRMVARRIELVGPLLRDPEVVVHKARALADHGLWIGHRPGGAAGHQLVADGLAHVV